MLYAERHRPRGVGLAGAVHRIWAVAEKNDWQFSNPRIDTVPREAELSGPIDLYRDVWIAAIASSRKSLATQTAAICVRFQGRRLRHQYVTMHITFLTRKSALIYRRGLRQRVASLTLDCNGVFAIRAYGLDTALYKTIPLPFTFYKCFRRVACG